MKLSFVGNLHHILRSLQNLLFHLKNLFVAYWFSKSHK